ncbi:MAG: DUF4097 domain-containing protein [Spirochaetales bacterium]|nr:DUF4097 domain-containing protein [Spirochaetales bacterium]
MAVQSGLKKVRNLLLIFVLSSGISAFFFVRDGIPGLSMSQEDLFRRMGGKVVLKIDEKYHWLASDLESIVVDLQHADLMIVSSESSEIDLRYIGQVWLKEELSGSIPFQSAYSEGRLRCSSSWGHDLVGSDVLLELSLPSHLLSSVQLNVHGDVSWDGGSAQYFETRGSSGDLSLRNFMAEEALLERSSGDMNLQRVQGRSWEAQMSSGDFTAFDMVLSEQLDITSYSGDINVESGETKTFLMNGKSGDVHIDMVSDYLELYATSGDVHAQLDSFPLQLKAMVKTGDVSIDLPNDTGFTLQVQTKTGDFHLPFSMEKAPGATDNEFIATVNGGGASKVFLSTASGDVSINTL